MSNNFIICVEILTIYRDILFRHTPCHSILIRMQIDIIYFTVCTQKWHQREVDSIDVLGKCAIQIAFFTNRWRDMMKSIWNAFFMNNCENLEYFTGWNLFWTSRNFLKFHLIFLKWSTQFQIWSSKKKCRMIFAKKFIYINRWLLCVQFDLFSIWFIFWFRSFVVI